MLSIHTYIHTHVFTHEFSQKTVAQDPARYIVHDPALVPMLRQFRASGMKVFLLTNSLFDYTQVLTPTTPISPIAPIAPNATTHRW